MNISLTDSGARASQLLTADLVNAIVEATARDWVQQAAMLLTVTEYLANANGGTGRTAVALTMLETARKLDPDVLSAPARLQ
jgi:hypothetical protein